MRSAAYFDIEVRRGIDIATPVVIAAVVQALHIAGRAGRYAINFPQYAGRDLGAQVRVFVDEMDTADALIGHLEDDGVDDLIKVRQCRSVDSVGAVKFWAETRLFKQNLQSKIRRRERHLSNLGVPDAEERLARSIEQWTAKHDLVYRESPFIRLRSLSTRQAMSLHVIVENAPSVVANQDGDVNSYGFASGENGIVLPVF